MDALAGLLDEAGGSAFERGARFFFDLFESGLKRLLAGSLDLALCLLDFRLRAGLKFPELGEERLDFIPRGLELFREGAELLFKRSEHFLLEAVGRLLEVGLGLMTKFVAEIRQLFGERAQVCFRGLLGQLGEIGQRRFRHCTRGLR